MVGQAIIHTARAMGPSMIERSKILAARGAAAAAGVGGEVLGTEGGGGVVTTKK